MSSLYPVPDVAKVRTLLGMLFDGMEVKAGNKVDPAARGAQVAVFISDEGEPVAACACDSGFAAAAGSALSMLPPLAAKDAARTGELTEVMQGNLNEIMNICSRLVMSDSSPHLRLEKVYPAAGVPAAAKALLAAPTARADFEVGLPKYGPGLVSVVSR